MILMHRSSQPPTPANLPAHQPLDLLAPHTRQLREIEQLAGVPKAHWRAYYFEALLAYAGYVQQRDRSKAGATRPFGKDRLKLNYS